MGRTFDSRSCAADYCDVAGEVEGGLEGSWGHGFWMDGGRCGGIGFL